jgi:hypothetical protein
MKAAAVAAIAEQLSIPRPFSVLAAISRHW